MSVRHGSRRLTVYRVKPDGSPASAAPLAHSPSSASLDEQIPSTPLGLVDTTCARCGPPERQSYRGEAYGPAPGGEAIWT
jgi:hypothetical protein